MKNPGEYNPAEIRIINVYLQRSLKLYLGEMFWTKPD